jgi:type II secretory pathway pseudopilin PulG
MKFKAKYHPLRKIFLDERGATLVEELATVAIIGFGLVILVAMITTGVVGVRQVDDEVLAESLARSQLELIKNAAYEPDPGTSPYPTPAPVAGYAVTVSVEYWNASSSTFTTTQRNDGMQKVTVTVSNGVSNLVQLATFKVSR